MTNSAISLRKRGSIVRETTMKRAALAMAMEWDIRMELIRELLLVAAMATLISK